MRGPGGLGVVGTGTRLYTPCVYTACIVGVMDTRLTLLGLLGAGPGYGYDLKTNWDHWFARTKPLAFGQVYSTLARLLRDGLIVQLGAQAGAGPDRKRYEITTTKRSRRSRAKTHGRTGTSSRFMRASSRQRVNRKTIAKIAGAFRDARRK